MDNEILELLKSIQSDILEMKNEIKDLKTQISENIQIPKPLEYPLKINNIKYDILSNDNDTSKIQMIKEIIKSELSQVSYDTWIAKCDGSIEEKILTWFCPNTFTQDILDRRYKELIFNACKLIGLEIEDVKILVK